MTGISDRFDWLNVEYAFDAVHNYWRRHGDDASWNYSDSDEVEERIARIVKSASDRSSESRELQDAMTDWPSLYHLSPRRANLLRPFRELLKGSILEIGAGCGPISRFLGETGAEVIAVEGSARRAAIAGARCIDLPNVKVIADDFKLLPRGAKFDVVTLIGVLEYARMFFVTESGDPVDALLQRAREFLRPDGVLIIAIENQLGLKYLAGCREDHVGQRMFGIEDRYRSDGVVTFGRVELEGRVDRVGLTERQWWFPQPDYKLPICLLSDRILEKDVDADFSSLLSENVRHDHQLTDGSTFSLEAAWRPVFRNRLLGDLANSFLVICSAQRLPAHNVLAVHYGVERRLEFKKEVRFEWTGANVVVRRERSHPERSSAEQQSLAMQLADEKFYDGESWHVRLVALMNADGWTSDQWVEWAATWFDAVLRRATIVAGTVLSPTTQVSGELLDAIPRNLMILPDGNVAFFDQEWVSEQPIELGYLVSRSAYDSLFSVTGCAQPAAGVTTHMETLFFQFTRSLKWDLSTTDLERYIEIEAQFQYAAAGSLGFPATAYQNSIPVRPRFEEINRSNEKIASLDGTIANLNEQLAGSRHETELARAEINRLLRIEQAYGEVIVSTTWRAASPLRRGGAILPPSVRLLVRRAAKAAYWVATPWKISARLKILRRRRAASSSSIEGSVSTLQPSPVDENVSQDKS